MAFLMVTVTFPPAKATEMGKAFLGLPKLPSFLKISQMFTVAAGESGIKVYAIYEVENEKMYEGLVAIGNRYVAYYNIEGFRHTIEPLLTMEEALPMIGLAPPK